MGQEDQTVQDGVIYVDLGTLATGRYVGVTEATGSRREPQMLRSMPR
jgi:hypothetical protein